MYLKQHSSSSKDIREVKYPTALESEVSSIFLSLTLVDATRTFRKGNGNAGTNLVKYLRHCHQATPAPALCQPGQSSWFSHKQWNQLVVRAYCEIVGTCHLMLQKITNISKWSSILVIHNFD